jgi:hypothetical protein
MTRQPSTPVGQAYFYWPDSVKKNRLCAQHTHNNEFDGKSSFDDDDELSSNYSPPDIAPSIFSKLSRTVLECRRIEKSI